MQTCRVTRPYRDRQTGEVVAPGTTVTVADEYADALVRARVAVIVADAEAPATAEGADSAPETATRNRARQTATRKRAKSRGA